jgi:DNA-binding HxlR family transcriptional regulator
MNWQDRSVQVTDRREVDRAGLEAAIDVLSAKWVPAVICELQQGPRRHGELAKTIGLHAKQLARALHRLNSAGLIHRDVDGDQSPPQVSYRLAWEAQDLLLHLDALVRRIRPNQVNGEE